MTESRAQALAVIIGRAGSKGLPGKNTLHLGGQPMVWYSIDAAQQAHSIDRIVVSTDDPDMASAARERNILAIDRPENLATDHATVDAAVRHAVEAIDSSHPIIVILYNNVPLRPPGAPGSPGLIDRAVQVLIETGADSAQSYSAVGKHHPHWMVQLDEAGRVIPLTPNAIYRRQDLPPVYIPDGGVLVVTRESLFTTDDQNPHAFLGTDRRGIISPPDSVIDIDSPTDFALAEEKVKRSKGQMVKSTNVDTLTFRPFDFYLGPLKIGSRTIDSDHPPYIIAEIGVNHDGSCERALALVDAASRAGADAVKLQLFEADRLLSRRAGLALYQQKCGANDPETMLRALELDDESMEKVIDRAHRAQLHAIVTIFSAELVERAERLPFDAYKTASPDLINRPLIERLMATGKPLLVSAGASTLEEVAESTRWLGNHHHALLHCVSSYPTPDDEAALAGRIAMLSVNPNALGYSDHTVSIDTGALAVAGGCRLLEKHITLERPGIGSRVEEGIKASGHRGIEQVRSAASVPCCPDASVPSASPDHATSLEPDAFAEYVQLAHRAWRMTGPIEKRVLEIEREVRTIARQSLTTTHALAAGHVLARCDLTVKRPGIGISPADIGDVIGRRIMRAVDADEPITMDLLR